MQNSKKKFNEIVFLLRHCANIHFSAKKKNDMTCVPINDPLGQTHSPASSDY